MTDDTNKPPPKLFLLHDEHSIDTVLRGYRPLEAQLLWLEGRIKLKWQGIARGQRQEQPND